MTYEEFLEWKIVYYKLEPFGEQRADLRAGHAVAPLINMLRIRWAKKDANPEMAKPSDWVMDFITKPIPKMHQTYQEMKSICIALAEAAKLKLARSKNGRGNR